MPEIEVDPERLAWTALRLRGALAEAHRVQRSTTEALGRGVTLTGSGELASALGRHADAWGTTIERADEQVGRLADVLAAGGRGYDWVESCVASVTGRPPTP